MLDHKILVDLQEYIENQLNKVTLHVYQEPNDIDKNMKDSINESIYEVELEGFIKSKRKPSLKQVLFEYIDATGATDPEIYNKAGVDRKHFSKIRSNPNYRPGKNTIIALALALELNKKDTETLLESAGYTLSDSDTNDLIIQFCIDKKIYNIHDVNQALNHFSLNPLIG